MTLPAKVAALTRAALSSALLSACAQAAPHAQPPPGELSAAPTMAPLSRSEGVSAPEAAHADDVQSAARSEVREMLARAADVRGLPVRRDVPSRVIDRSAILERIREHVARELPEGVLVHQGEALAALELIPTDYEFAAGVYRLLEGRIAGFYEPEDATMYLVDDLSESEARETLAHELIHALQDQSFALGQLLKFTAGDSDRLSAVHALVEGDAMSAMFDLVAGSAFDIDEEVLRKLVAMSTALSAVGDTPRVLQESLGAPYTDGFAFVQALRRSGGWRAVDDAFRAPPQTTEQLLHADKLRSREPAVAVPVPPTGALGPGFRPVFDDVMGEQGLRMALAEFVHRGAAAAAAAGWGGDRFVVARRDDADDPARRAFALAWRLRFDTPPDARELAAVLTRRFGKGCRMRPALGPLAWSARGADVALVAGPYERRGVERRALGTCVSAKSWADDVLKTPLSNSSGE